MDNSELEVLRGGAQYSKMSSTITGYSRLRELISDTSAAGRATFNNEFWRYYGFGGAGLTEEWRKRYFELFFDYPNMKLGNPYHQLLTILYDYPRRKGDKALQLSFVSKLIAFYDETRPLHDKFVGAYFGMAGPSFGPIDFRITQFVANLNEIARRYRDWLTDPSFLTLIAEVRATHSEAANCNPLRICDFLVWSAGRETGRRTRSASQGA